MCPICLWTAPAHLELFRRSICTMCGERRQGAFQEIRHRHRAVQPRRVCRGNCKLQNRKDAARQVRKEQHRKQSLYNAVKGGAETALSHRRKVYHVIKAKKKKNRTVVRPILTLRNQTFSPRGLNVSYFSNQIIQGMKNHYVEGNCIFKKLRKMRCSKFLREDLN